MQQFHQTIDNTWVPGLPVETPLKAAMTGVELLVDRSQLWEQSAAKHVSIADHLEKLLALARRWRQFELSSWRLLSARVQSASAEGIYNIVENMQITFLLPCCRIHYVQSQMDSEVFWDLIRLLQGM